MNDRHLPTPYTIDPAVLRASGAGTVATGNGTFNVTIPPAAVAQDLLILHLTQATATVPATPAGWTLVVNSGGTGGFGATGIGQATFFEKSTGAGGGTVSVTSTAAAVAEIFVYRGVDTSVANTGCPSATCVIDAAAAGPTATNTTSITLPTLTTGMNNQVVVGVGSTRSDTAWPATAGLYALESPTHANNSTTISLSEYDKNVAASGTVIGTQAVTTTTGRGIGFTFGLLNDTGAPTAGTVALTPVTGNSYLSGTTVYYNGTNAGSFTLADPFTDAQSAPFSVQYPLVGTAGWTHALETVTAAPNFTSSTYSWNAGSTTSPGSQTLTIADSANNTATQAVTVTNDNTAPTAGAISVPTTSSSLSGNVITTTNYTDAGSGIAGNVITRSNAQTPTVPGAACPTSGYTGSTVVTSPDTVPTDGMCYVYTLTGTDNVGNTASVVSSPILVDTSATSSSAVGGGATTLAWSHTVPNKALRMLVVGVTTEYTSTACQATGVTYGAQTMTLISSTSVTGASFECSSLWYLIAPAVGTNTITVTLQNAVTSVAAGAVNLWNIKQAAPDAFNVGSNTAGASTTSVTTLAANSTVIDAFASGNALGTMAPDPSQTQRWVLDDPPSASGGMSTKLVPVAGAASMTWAGGPINRSAQVVAAFAPGDTTPPTNTLTLTSVSPGGSAYLSGSTIYYHGGAGYAGSFQIQDAVADAGSGPASATFAALGGTTTGWTHTAQSINTPAGGPYVSTNSYSWVAGTNSSPTVTVTGFDAVGFPTTTTLTLVDDELPPTNSISVTPGTNPLVQYYNSGTSTYYYNPSTLGGTFTVNGPSSDAGSGIAQEVFPGINGTSSQILAQSPVLYWRFSEPSGTAVADSASGNLNGGTVTTTAPGTVTRNAAGALPGDPDPGITFTPSTGATSVVKASPSNIPSGTASRTIEAWFKTTTTTEQAIASYGCSACANGQNFGFDVMSSTSLQFWGFGSADLTFATPYTITDGNWHQGVIEYDGTSISMYLDGIYLGSKADAINTTAPGVQGFNVGVNNPVGDATNGGKYFNGSIDEVAVYPAALTATKVETHYLARTSLATTGFTGAVAVDTTPAYVSATHTFTTSNTTAPGPETIGALDNVGNFGQSTLTFVRDVTAPTLGAFSANGTAGTLAGTSSYLTSGTTLAINSRTDYTEASSGTQSGLKSSILTIQSATLTGNACGAYGSATTITGTTSQTVASGNCYLLTLTGTDNVNNTAAIFTVVKVDTTAPSAPTTFGFSALTNAYYSGAGTTIYLKGGAAGGFTATASGAADADTGIASYTYGAIAGTGWANAAGVYTFTAASPSGSASVTANNGAGVAGSAATFTATVDSTAPSGGAFTANSVVATAGGSSSYLNSGTTLLINSRTDFTDGGSGLASSTLTMQTGTLSGNACSAYGAPATITGTTSQTVASAHCYLLTLTGTDNVGNVAPTISTTVKVDTTAPSAPTGFTFSGLTSSYYPGAGTIIYTKAGAAGGFTATASGSADADTGISGYTYGAIAGTGWANVAGAFTFTAASPTGTSSVTASNNAGLTSSATTFTAQSDGTAPAGGALTANSIAASGPGTTSYLNSGTTLLINSRTDYTDGGSGLASSTLTMQTGTLSGNSCSAYGAPAAITGTTSQTVASGNCYLLTLTGTDNVGNTASISTTVKVDTTAPSAPTGFTFSGLTNAYYSGAGSTVYVKGGAIGGFTATASGAADADTGLAGYNYGAIAGTGWANAAGAYTFTAASPSGTGAVTATNNAGLTGLSASFTATVDSTAPATGAFMANSVAATGGGSSSNITAGTTLLINSRTDYTDGGSGLASSTLTMQTGTLSGNVCSAYGAPATIAGTTSQTVASGNCYLLTLTGTDNVGNTASISTTVKVDTTAPSAPTGFSFSGMTNAYYPGAGTTIYFKGGAAGGFSALASGSTDAESGIATYNYGAIAGAGWANVGGAYTFTGISPTGTGSATATNGVGVTGASASFTAQSDSTAPAGGALTANSIVASGVGTSSYLNSGTTLLINSRTDYTDGGSGLASSTLTMQTGTLSGNTCSAYGAPATIAGTTSQTVASGHCYLLTLTGTDNVGNTASISTTVKVDTTAPSAPTGFTFSGLSNAYYPGAGSTVYFKGGAAGGFTATASGATDADTGLAGYNYGAIVGTGWANGAGAYTFTAASPSGTGAVTATNNAGLTGSSASFTATVDATAPSGGAFLANSVAATGGGSSSYVNSGTTLLINSRTDYTDGGSGLASSTLTMQTGTLSGNCVQRLRRTRHRHRHNEPDGRQRQLLPAHAHRHRQRRQRRLDLDHRQGRHHRAERADRLRLRRLHQQLLPGCRLDRLLQGRIGRRLHRHRLRRHRRRHRHRGLQLRRRRRHRLGQRGRRLHLHRSLAERHRRGHGNERRRRHRLQRHLHRHRRRHRPERWRLLGQQHRSHRRRQLQLRQQRHHAVDQQPHRLHRRRLRTRVLHPDDADRHALRQQLQRLRRTRHHHRHHLTDRGQRQLLPAHAHRHRQRRQHRLDQHDGEGRHHSPERPDGHRVLGLDQRLLPGRGHDHLLQGRHRRRLHRHRFGLDRRRHRRVGLQLRRRRRHRLGQRSRRLHLHRRLPHRHRRPHRDEQRRTHGQQHDLHGPVRHHRPVRRCLLGERHRGDRRRQLELPHGRHDAFDQQPHRLHRQRLGHRLVDADHPVGVARGQQLQLLRRTQHDQRHHLADRRQRQLLPAHPHGDRQRGHHGLDQHDGEGRHDAAERADRFRLLRADQRVLLRRRLDRLHQGRRCRRLHRHRERIDRCRDRSRVVHLRCHRRNRLGEHG